MSDPRTQLIQNELNHVYGDLAHILRDVSEIITETQKVWPILDRYEETGNPKDLKGVKYILKRDLVELEHLILDAQHVREDIVRALALIHNLKKQA